MASASNPSASGESSYRRLASAQLRSIAWLDRCDPAVIDNWVQRGVLEHFGRDALICRQGDESDGMTLVVDGAVATGTWLGQRDAHIVSYLGPGDLQGMLPAIDGQPQALDMMAHEPCILLRIPNALVREGIQRDTRVIEALTQQLAHRMRIMYDKLREAATLSVAQQLARQLDTLARSYGAPREQGIVIRLRLSQENLAQLLGASRQQINSELKKLEARGVLRIARESITILDAAALQGSTYSNRPVTLLRQHLGLPREA